MRVQSADISPALLGSTGRRARTRCWRERSSSAPSALLRPGRHRQEGPRSRAERRGQGAGRRGDHRRAAAACSAIDPTNRRPRHRRRLRAGLRRDHRAERHQRGGRQDAGQLAQPVHHLRPVARLDRLRRLRERSGRGAHGRIRRYPPERLSRPGPQGPRSATSDPMLDPNIRTAKVRIWKSPNPGLMRVGMFVTATFHGQSKEMHATVPATAVLHLHDRDWVYVPAGQQAVPAPRSGRRRDAAGQHAGDRLRPQARQTGRVQRARFCRTPSEQRVK